MSLPEHLRLHGDLPALAASRRRDRASSLVEELTRADLRGRGGAGFPIARKLQSVAAARGRPVVVVNGCEGEPASAKDRLLLDRCPHLVIDGALTCARALGADEIVFAVESGGSASISAAISERPDLRRRGSTVRVVGVPPGYVSSQESALVNVINGGPAKPTFTPPMVFERGVSRRPTLVSNAETIAHVALIARHGGAWFRELGTPEQPGSALVTLSGAVATPAVYEIEYGMPLEVLLQAAGGLTTPARAFLFGGYAGAWVDAAYAPDLTLDTRSLTRAGATLGAGVVVALPQTACPVAETVRVAEWMAGQSAGQCGPCVHGLAAIAGALSQLARGVNGAQAHDQATRWAQLVTRRGACAHPDGVARLIVSALRVFADEFADHAHYGPCPACAQVAVLPLDDELPLAA
jgi:NADH:ubiquinone oxidoreductase subunit F (NADH-binding)